MALLGRFRGLALLVILAGSSPTRAGDLPPDLALVPGDAAGYALMNVPKFVASPFCDDARFALDGLRPGEFAALAKKFAVDPATLERIVVILPTGPTVLDPVPAAFPTAMSGLMVVRCSKPFDPVKLSESFFPSGWSKTYRGRKYQFGYEQWAGVLCLPGNQTFVYGAEDSLVWLIDRMEKGVTPGPMLASVEESVNEHVFVSVIPGTVIPPNLLAEPYRPILQAERITLTAAMGEKTQFTLKLHYPDARAAEVGAKALKAAVAVFRQMMGDEEEKLRQLPKRPAKPEGVALNPIDFPTRLGVLLGAGIWRRYDRELAELPIERENGVVKTSIGIKIPSWLGVTAATVLVSELGENRTHDFYYVGSTIRPSGAPTSQELRLRKVHAAMEAYHEKHGHYPTAASYDDDGRPLMSWRVTLLPYIGEKKLYDEFHHDEPWDSLHNKKLLSNRPAVFGETRYANPKSLKALQTNTFVVHGPETLFRGALPVRKLDLPEGKLLLAFEVAEISVYWTKPADVIHSPATKFSLKGQRDTWAVFTDGSTRMLTEKADEANLGKMITGK